MHSGTAATGSRGWLAATCPLASLLAHLDVPQGLNYIFTMLDLKRLCRHKHTANPYQFLKEEAVPSLCLRPIAKYWNKT